MDKVTIGAIVPIIHSASTVQIIQPRNIDCGIRPELSEEPDISYRW